MKWGGKVFHSDERVRIRFWACAHQGDQIRPDMFCIMPLYSRQMAVCRRFWSAGVGIVVCIDDHEVFILFLAEKATPDFFLFRADLTRTCVSAAETVALSPPSPRHCVFRQARVSRALGERNRKALDSLVAFVGASESIESSLGESRESRDLLILLKISETILKMVP